MPVPETLPAPEKTFAKLPASPVLRPLLLPLPLGEGWGEGLPGNHLRVMQRSPEATQRRVRRLIQELVRRIQDRRLATAIALPVTPPRSVKPGQTPDTPEARGNGTPPTSPPGPAQSAPSTLLRRLVADRPRPPRQRKVRA